MSHVSLVTCVKLRRCHAHSRRHSFYRRRCYETAPELISFTVWGFTDSDSWLPGTFAGEWHAGIYDVNQNPKAACYALQSDLALAAYGAPQRVRTYEPRA